MISRYPLPPTIMLVGPYTVVRRPISGTLHNSYTVMDGETPVWSAMSHPSEEDCAAAIRQHRNLVVVPKKRGRPAGRVINGVTRAVRAAA